VLHHEEAQQSLELLKQIQPAQLPGKFPDLPFMQTTAPHLNAMNALLAMDALLIRWSARSDAEFRVLTHVYPLACASPNGIFKQSDDDIAKATALSLKNAATAMGDLCWVGIIERVQGEPQHDSSVANARQGSIDWSKKPYAYQIPRRYLQPPNDPASVLDSWSLVELIHWLTGYWPNNNNELLAELMTAAHHDEERLQVCLASVLRGRMLTGRNGRSKEKAVWTMTGPSELIVAVRYAVTAHTVQ
jgi:hypothetical protein